MIGKFDMNSINIRFNWLELMGLANLIKMNMLKFTFI